MQSQFLLFFLAFIVIVWFGHPCICFRDYSLGSGNVKKNWKRTSQHYMARDSVILLCLCIASFYLMLFIILSLQRDLGERIYKLSSST